MFERWKEKREHKRARNIAIRESMYWREHALLHNCMGQMRGCCTVAPRGLHEAAVAVVNIAMEEGGWMPLRGRSEIPQDFMPEHVFLVWDDPKLPVLRSPWKMAERYLQDVRAVSDRTFLVSEYLNRIISFDEEGQPLLYSVA